MNYQGPIRNLLNRKREQLSNRVDELGNQAQLWDDGEISETESEVVETETLEPSSEGPLPLDEAVKAARATTAPEAKESKFSFLAPLMELIQGTPDPYLIAIGAGILASFLSWRMSALAWLAVALGALALQVTRSKDGRWMPWVGIVLGVIFTIVNLTSGPAETSAVAALPNPSPAEEVVPDPPDGSLGFRFNNLAEEWNALDQPPFITTGIKASDESGALDSFKYRFDDAALVAGAYDSTDGYIYAIFMRAGLRSDAISQMYVRLCYLVHPGSQDCLDTFIEENGMFGKTPLDFIDVVHDVSWTFEGNEWRLTITDNVQTIRVQDPRGPG